MKRSLPIVLLGLAALSWLAACSKKDVDRPAELVDIKPQLKVERLWSHSFGGGADRLRLALRPSIDDGVIFAAGYDGDVAALTTKDGDKKWSIKTKLPLSAGPAVGEGVVVLGALDGNLVALNESDGSERWRHRMSSEVLARPVIAKSMVLVRTVDGRVTALGLKDGEQRWVSEQTVPKLSLRGTAPVTVVGDMAVTGFDNGRVVAVDILTGDTQWDTVVDTPRGKNELERLVDIDGPVRAVDEDIYVMGFQGRVAMLARDTGQIWWARDFSTYRGFAIQGADLYASSADGTVVAMRRSDGSVLWQQPALHMRALSAPVVDGNTLVVGDYEGYVHWLDITNGNFVARAKTDGDRITNAPLVADGRVYIQTDGGKLIAFATKAKS